jgi:transposase
VDIFKGVNSYIKTMANQPISMQQIRTIIQLLEQGYSHRRISSQLQLARNTIAAYTKRLQNSGYHLAELRNLDDGSLSELVYGKATQAPNDVSQQQLPATSLRKNHFDSQVAHFRSELKRTGVTRLLLWQGYKQSYPDGYEYSQFCELLRLELSVSEAVMHFNHTPGETMMIDFAGDKMHYVEKETGVVVACPVFVAVLPYSGYSFVIALSDATSPQVIKALNACLHYFAGAPRSIKCDNMAQAVKKSCRYEPVFTDMFTAWALHNYITPMAARAAKPKDKAPVENEVKIAYRRIYAPLRDSVFFSLAELNHAIIEQLCLHHGQVFQKKSYSRKTLFEKEEQPLLQPLPPSTYYIRHSVQAKVQKNYHIVLGEDWHYYSVPFRYIGKDVNAVYDSDTVEIYYEHKRIALHRRSYKAHAYTTQEEHMPEKHKKYKQQCGWDSDYFLGQAQKIGDKTFAYIDKMIKSRPYSQQAYNSCLGVLRLAKVYGNDRLEAACNRSLQAEVYSYRTLHNILSNNLDRIKEPEQLNLFSIPDHENLRGAQAYQ